MDAANASQITFPNNSVNILELSDHNNRTVKYGVDATINDTDTKREIDRTETVVRDQDYVRDADLQDLDDAQRLALSTCATRLTREVCDVMFSSKEKLIEQADKIFTAACSLEARLEEEHKAQIEDIKCQFYRDITKGFDLRARSAGSSRNSFVIQQQDSATCDMLRKLAALQAELKTDAIKSQQTALVNAHVVSQAARIQGLQAVLQAAVGLWSILKGARRITNETGHTDDDSTATMNEMLDQDVTQLRFNLNWVRQVSQTVEGATQYDADYNANSAALPVTPILP